MGLRILLALPFATAFTSQKLALVRPIQALSPLVLFEIDIQSVTDSVSFERKESPQTPASPPPPVVYETPRPPVEESVTSETASTPPPPKASTPAPPKSADVAPVAIQPPTLPSGLDVDLPLPAIAGGLLAAFAVGTFAMRGRADEETSTSTPDPVPSPAPAVPSTPAAEPAAPGSDVSIPYDAAARMAYDEWRRTHSKGTFDEAKYQKFKATYETITSANMAAKKKARDEGETAQMEEIPATADA